MMQKSGWKPGRWMVLLLCLLVLVSGCGGDDDDENNNGAGSTMGGGAGGGAGDDHGQTAATVTVVNANSQTAGVLSSAQDADVFQITLPSSGTLRVSTTGTTDTLGLLLRSLAGCATSGSIFDGPDCGNPIAMGDDEDGQNFRIVATNLPAGTYFVVVETFEKPGSYTFVSSFTPTP